MGAEDINQHTQAEILLQHMKFCGVIKIKKSMQWWHSSSLREKNSKQEHSVKLNQGYWFLELRKCLACQVL